jgi:hypothetical protein
MSDVSSKQADPSPTPDPGDSIRLGGVPKGKIQRYFCVDDEDYHALSMVSADARIIRRDPKQVMVLGRQVDGWLVELEVSPTDGVVRSYPDEKPMTV